MQLEGKTQGGFDEENASQNHCANNCFSLYLGSRHDDRRHFFGRETGTFIRTERTIQKLPTQGVLREFAGRERHILA